MKFWPSFPLPPPPPAIVRRGTLPTVPTAEQRDVSVVIVHRNAPGSLLEECLAALDRARQRMCAQVILVDQNSPAPVLRALGARFPWLQIVVDRSDGGYAVSNNLGLRRAVGRYLLLLNDDVVLLGTALAELVAWMDAHPRAGYAGPRLTLPNGGLDLACRRGFPTPIVSLYRLSGLSRLFPRSRHFARYNLTYLPVDTTAPVDAVVGACMLVRRQAAEEVGLLDERYFMYGEDLDWAFRLHKAGWEGWYVATAAALHYKGSSSKRRRLRTTYEFYRAMAIFYRRHYAPSAPWAVTWLVLTGILMRATVAIFVAWRDQRAQDTEQ